jgi:hypothetical protein
MIHHTESNPKGLKITPAPDWTAIFTLRPELQPPGYVETLLHCIDNPRIKPKQVEKEKIQAKKKKKKLGRGQSA